MAGANQRVRSIASTPAFSVRGEVTTAHDAARQLSSDGRRKGQGEDSRRFSRDHAEGRAAILRDVRAGRLRVDLPDESLGRDREEAGEATFEQRSQAEISRTHQLLRTSGRGGWAGARFDSTCIEGIGGDEGRG